MSKEEPEARNIEAVSGVNRRGEGFVHIAMEYGPNKERAVLQATPAEARQISRQIAEAAEAADTDAFLFQFLQKKVGVDFNAAGQVLIEFRQWREISGGVKLRDEKDPHWQDMLKKNKDQGMDPTKR